MGAGPAVRKVPRMRPALRIGDAEREYTVAALRHHTTAGRLTLAEFDQRAERAYAARTDHDLGSLTVDLPSLAATPISPHRPRTAPTAMAAVAALVVIAGLVLLAALLPAVDAHAVAAHLGAMCGMG